MSSVTPEVIKLFLPDTELSDASLSAFITTAEKFLESTEIAGNVDSGLYEELVKWVTAHFITATVERLAIQEKAGPVEQKFANVYYKNLSATPYGQTAITIDPTGTLKKLSSEKKMIQYLAVTEGFYRA